MNLRRSNGGSLWEGYWEGQLVLFYLISCSEVVGRENAVLVFPGCPHHGDCLPVTGA